MSCFTSSWGCCHLQNALKAQEKARQVQERTQHLAATARAEREHEAAVAEALSSARPANVRGEPAPHMHVSKAPHHWGSDVLSLTGRQILAWASTIGSAHQLHAQSAVSNGMHQLGSC